MHAHCRYVCNCIWCVLLLLLCRLVSLPLDGCSTLGGSSKIMRYHEREGEQLGRHVV